MNAQHAKKGSQRENQARSPETKTCAIRKGASHKWTCAGRGGGCICVCDVQGQKIMVAEVRIWDVYGERSKCDGKHKRKTESYGTRRVQSGQ